MKQTTHDVSIVGAGPAGMALAAELTERGLSVAVLEARPGAWPQTFGAFEDELVGLGLSQFIARRYERPWVFVDPAPLALDRTYALVNNPCLHSHLSDRLDRAVEPGGVLGVEGAADVQRIRLSGGREHVTRLVVDATGRGLGADRSSAAQVALGWVAEVDELPWPRDQAVWMDFRGVEDPEPPTFLYALPLGRGRVLLEETSLASSPALSWPVLGARLRRRLSRLGVRVRRVVHEERVHIPLDRAPTRPTGGVLSFGASAGFVHPATGYSLVRSLRTAPAVADAIAQTLEDGPLACATAAHAAAWPTRSRATRALHRAGLEVLLSLDAGQTRRFFRAFFELAPDQQAAWLDPSGHPIAVARAMATLFGAASAEVRTDVLLAALRRGPTPTLALPEPGGSR